MTLTPQRVRELFDYDPETGRLTWRVRRKTALVGSEARSLHRKGHMTVTVDKRHYYVHRIVWAHFYGRWPERQIDHINCVKTDNRLVNLREASPQENARNRSNRRGRVLPKGVKLLRQGKWQATITIDGKRLHLGTFSSVEAAAQAYSHAARERFGEFARVA